MRPYEVMIIFDVNVDEADIRQHVERVLDLVKSRGGTVAGTEYWGRRTFAYELKHRTEGYYVVVEILAEPATLAEADRLLALEDAVLRHKAIRLPDNVAGRKRPTRRRSPGPSSGSGGGGGARPSGPRPSEGTHEAPTVVAEAAENAAAESAEVASDPAAAVS